MILPEPGDFRDLTGRKLGDFEVVRLLGRGGMGEVYEAKQASLQRRVALKVLRDDLVHNRSYLERFKSEALAVAPIIHPNIVSVLAIGEHEGVHYIALEYVDGRNLREHIHRQGALEERDAVAILKKVAAALQRAHDENIVHRDIKPENILLTRRTATRQSEVKVADFGLAKRLDADVSVTQSGMTMGTPLYMSPEQIKGKPADARSDVYSLGVTAYHMLAGEPPYTGDTALAVAGQHLQGAPKKLRELRPDLSPDLEALVERMMAPKVDRRVSTCREVLKELNRLRPGATSLRPGETGDATAPHVAQDDDFLHSPAAPAATTLGNRRVAMSQTLSHVVDAFSDRRRLPWLGPVVVGAAMIAGGATAWLQREPDRLAAAATTTSRRPSTANVEAMAADSRKQFEEALAQKNWVDREKLFWFVMQSYQNDSDAGVVLDAAVELFEGYLSRCDYDMVLEVADFLGAGGRDREDRTYSGLMKGIVYSRRGDAAESNNVFVRALESVGQESRRLFSERRLRKLAVEFYACIRKNGEQPSKRPGEKLVTPEDLRKLFLKRFQV